jgi:hypothetical protein
MNAEQQVRAAFDDFEDAQKQFSEFGAYDTEPSWEFHNLIRNAVTTGKGVLPRSARGWQMFDEMEGIGNAIKGMNKAAKKARDLTLKHWGNIKVREFVKGECWRVDF